MRMKWILAFVAAAVAASPAAQAVPVTWTVDAGMSSVIVNVLATNSNAITIAGTVSGDLSPGSLSATSSALSTTPFSINLGVLGSLNGTAFVAGFTGGPTGLAPGLNTTSIADLTGFTLSLLTGTISGTGLVGGFLPTNPIVVTTAAPIDFPLPTTLSMVENTGVDAYKWTIPVAATTQLSGVDLTITGQIVLNTMATIPEPGTLVLLAAGVVGLALAGRKQA